MKIAHLKVADTGLALRGAGLTRMIGELRGVSGVVAVGSIGLVTVLYDERRTDPVVISEHILRARAAQDAGEVPPEQRAGRPSAARRVRRRHLGTAGGKF